MNQPSPELKVAAAVPTRRQTPLLSRPCGCITRPSAVYRVSPVIRQARASTGHVTWVSALDHVAVDLRNPLRNRIDFT